MSLLMISDIAAEFGLRRILDRIMTRNEQFTSQLSFGIVLLILGLWIRPSYIPDRLLLGDVLASIFLTLHSSVKLVQTWRRHRSPPSADRSHNRDTGSF
jgi:multisubunit Na+/H+ antiporter MnhG subunit